MKISIITATFNSGANISQCVTSVNEQTCNNIEHIIIDGASKDNTLDIVKSIPNRVTRTVSEPDNGIYDAMNKGIRLASGDIIGILNSDDIYENKNVLSRVAQEFEKDSCLEAIHSNLYYVRSNSTNKIIRHWITGDFVPGSFFKGWHPAHPTLFLKREVYEKYGLFDQSFKLAADFEFMLRIFERFRIKSKYLPTPTVKMRLGGATNKSFSNIIKGNVECLRAFRKNNFNIPVFYTFYRILPKFKQFVNKR
ncbi:glycosyltransferase [Maribellus comscasis]|uniref:Glycosyltransferase n=1 Tax=Maribellus comscasis TaxID=2681766 RepID=A0A6I6K928_9BACT|nr:glycosyltransferase family 2 protein [Maribellus comscasis]QGY46574.1 glycosyltransferase [Maribellus comscasis]